MKRLLSTIITMFFIGCFVAPVFAAGTYELIASGSMPGSERMWKQYQCTADASDGSMPAITITGFKGYHLFTVETWPGGTAPTDATDFTLADAVTGEDFMGAKGTDGIDATTPLTIIPYLSAQELYYFPLVKGELTLTITNNSVNSAIMNIRITGAK